MPFDWNSYISLGRTLHENKQPEYLRASISRGYYGLYNQIRNYLRNSSRFKPHKELIDALITTEKLENGEELSGLLQELKEQREVADYDGLKNIDAAYSNRFWSKLEYTLQLFNESKV